VPASQGGTRQPGWPSLPLSGPWLAYVQNEFALLALGEAALAVSEHAGHRRLDIGS
jgi:hypothetical protein